MKTDVSHMHQQEYFDYIVQLKEELTIKDYCYSPDSKLLKPFISEVMNLEYEEKPNYNKLKFLLVKILIDQDFFPRINQNPLDDPHHFQDIDSLNVPDEKRNYKRFPLI